MEKTYVLDTNVLIHDPDSIFKFGDNNVIIPIYVIEEIDKFKHESSERGRSCRSVSRSLDALRSKMGSIGNSVGLPNGGTLRVVSLDESVFNRLGDDISYDNAILKMALKLKYAGDSTTDTILVTMDVNLRIKADSLNLKAEEYLSSKVVQKDKMYSGVVEAYCTSDDIDSFFRSGKVDISGFYDESVSGKLYPNTYIQLISVDNNQHKAIGKFEKSSGYMRKLNTPKDGIFGVKTRSREQAFAIDMLLDDNIKLVTLTGIAGTGKTMIASLVGLHKVIETETHSRLLISRPVIPMGRDIGFLPGDVNEKLRPWMQPIFDNIEFIGKRSGKTEDFQKLLDEDIIHIEPLTYIRGRSIPDQFFILDESQNTTPHEVKSIITRCGEGTKIVLTGDPYQIDNPYVDAVSNGLIYTAEKFKEHGIAGHMSFVKGERSKLADLAANIM